jgi:hypothetical protein
MVFFYFFFSFNLDLLQIGVLVIIFRRLLALVIVGGDHGASKTENSP